MLEVFQTSFIRPISGMGELSYEERLERLGLYPLVFRRVRGDLIETHKILNCLDRVYAERMFPLLRESRTRGRCLKI